MSVHVHTLSQVLQLQAMPYRKSFDDYLALCCSLSLTVLLLCTIFYKYASLTELPDILARMSIEQREDFILPTGQLTIVFFVCVIGAFAFSTLLLAWQMASVARQQHPRREHDKAWRGLWTIRVAINARSKQRRARVMVLVAFSASASANLVRSAYTTHGSLAKRLLFASGHSNSCQRWHGC